MSLLTLPIPGGAHARELVWLYVTRPDPELQVRRMALWPESRWLELFEDHPERFARIEGELDEYVKLITEYNQEVLERASRDWSFNRDYRTTKATEALCKALLRAQVEADLGLASGELASRALLARAVWRNRRTT